MLIFRQIGGAGLHNSHLHTTEAEHHANYFETSESSRGDSTRDPTDGTGNTGSPIDIASVSGVTRYLLLIMRRGIARRAAAAAAALYRIFRVSAVNDSTNIRVTLFCRDPERQARRAKNRDITRSLSNS